MEFDLKSSKIFFEEAFAKYRKTDETPDILVEYYPYVNTNHTIRFRENEIKVRISDTFRSAPAEIHHALAYILVAKLLRKRIPEEKFREYQSYIRTGEFLETAYERKRAKGRKMLSSPIGQRFDLEEMFSKLNGQYFEGSLEQPELSWSQRPTFRRLGHHDPAHNVIVISRSLDAGGVPQYVTEFVVYHEMLHLKHPVVFRNGRRYSHTAAFRRDEERFEFYEEAEDWIERNAGNLRKYAKRKR